MKKFLGASTLMLVAMGANAELMTINVDAEGDNRAVVDTLTGIEWLNITETKNMSVNQVMGLLDTTYAGWRMPTEAEVAELFAGYIDADLSLYGVVASNDLTDFRNKMGMSGTNRTQGAYLVDGGFMNAAVIGNKVYAPQSEKLPLWTNLDAKWSYVSVFLVNDGGVTLSSIQDPSINTPRSSEVDASVPLTGSALLLAGGLMGLRRTRKAS